MWGHLSYLPRIRSLEHALNTHSEIWYSVSRPEVHLEELLTGWLSGQNINYFMFCPVCELVSKIADVYKAIGGRNLFRPQPTLQMYFVHLESWLSG